VPFLRHALPGSFFALNRMNIAEDSPYSSAHPIA